MNALAKPTDRILVTQLQALMLQAPQVDLPVINHFSKDVYARELFLPKGVMITGHIHKYENLNILAKGKLKLLVDNEIKEVEAGFIMIAPPGAKRAMLALEDCIWVTIHGTDEKNIDLIEQRFIAHDEQEYLEFVGGNQLALPGFKND